MPQQAACSDRLHKQQIPVSLRRTTKSRLSSERPAVGPISPTSTKLTETSHTSDSEGQGDIGDGENEDANDDSDGEDQPNVFAPPDDSKWTGRQVGQSGCSMKKRGWSDLSGDDDYDAVDLISESDGGEPLVESLEEKMIIESEEDNEDSFLNGASLAGPRSDTSDDWEGFDGGLGLAGGLYLSDIPFFDEQIGITDHETLIGQIQLFNETSIFEETTPVASPLPARRVRFADEVFDSSQSTASTASDVDGEIFSDLFVQQDLLDPRFRQLIEDDKDEDMMSITDTEGQDWDSTHNGHNPEFRHTSDVRSRLQHLVGLGGFIGHDGYGNSGGSSSGYETDLGETTDEELMPPATINRPDTLLRLNSPSSAKPSATTSPTRTPARKSVANSSGARRGPRVGLWYPDPEKPWGTYDLKNKKIVIFEALSPPNRTPSTFPNSHNSPRASFSTLVRAPNDSETDRKELSSQGNASVMLASGVDLMMPGLFHGGPGVASDPVEALYPRKSSDTAVTIGTESSFDSEGAAIEDFHIAEFIHDSSNSDEDAGAASTVTPSTKDTLFAQQANAASGTSTTSLLHRFQRVPVSAFQLNQARHKTLLHGKTPNASVIRGGRQVAANTSLSPLRKRKASRSIGGRASPLIAVAALKSASNGHKRRKTHMFLSG